ncbi:MAG TPA: hypothetical protein VJ044_01330, partial [Candidatus Hodarchaeales archaeon]|nr:hypothetical protein [Candidatus Hodarchaeales archaeon]
MKKILFCLYAVLTLVSAQEQNRGIVVVGKPDEKNLSMLSSLYDNSYAVLVGINKYSDDKINRLEYACADAKGI